MEGTILDDSTGQGIGYVRLSLRHTQLSTVSNADGAYRLRLPSQGADTLEVHVLGYTPQAFLVQASERLELDIRLTPEILALEAVTIIGATPQELIEKAIERIPENYPDQASNWEAFYRESTNYDFQEFVVKGSEVSVKPASYLVESLLEVHLPTDFKEDAQFQLLKGQVKSHNFNQKIEATGKEATDGFLSGLLFGGGGEFSLHESISPDFIRSSKDLRLLTKEKQFNKRFTCHLKGMTLFRGRQSYVLQLNQRPEVRRRGSILDHTFYIDTATLAIVAWYRETSESAEEYYPHIKLFGMSLRLADGKSRTEYTLHQGKWHLAYSQTEVEVAYHIPKRLMHVPMNARYTCEVQSEFVMLRPLEGLAAPIPPEEQFTKKEYFQDEMGEYDPDFWEGEAVVPVRKKLKQAQAGH